MSATDRSAVTKHEVKKMKDAQKEYGDIIDRPHHVSKKRQPMSRLNRAAQFSPFAALTGYDALVSESARVTSTKVELADDDLAFIDRKLQFLQAHLLESPRVTIIYFERDAKKAGGEYRECTGIIKRIDTVERCIIMSDDRHIFIADVLDIAGDILTALDD